MYLKGNGFSLIEVMVALVVLVIGLVGVFNLHIVSKRGSFESFQQTQAAYYANDIVNRMKLNKSQLANYSGNYSGAAGEPTPRCEVAVATVNAGAAGVLCSSVQTKNWDLYQWQELFTGQHEELGGKGVGGLDTPTACIKIANDNVSVSVVMTWRGIRETKDGGANLAFACGTASDRRRVYVLDTVII